MASADNSQMVAAVDELVHGAQPAQFHKELHVEYSGAVAMAIEEQRAVRADLTAATSLTFLLVLLAMYLHFRSARQVLFVRGVAHHGDDQQPVAVATATFAVTS